MAKILTIKAIEAAKPKEQEYKLTIDRGLYIRVATNGVKTWLVTIKGIIISPNYLLVLNPNNEYAGHHLKSPVISGRTPR